MTKKSAFLAAILLVFASSLVFSANAKKSAKRPHYPARRSLIKYYPFKLNRDLTVYGHTLVGDFRLQGSTSDMLIGGQLNVRGYLNVNKKATFHSDISADKGIFEALKVSGDSTLKDLTVSGSTTLAKNSIDSNEILDATISTADIADSAISSVKLADNTIGTIATADIADGAVTFAKLSGTIALSNIADDSITAAKIAADAVGASELADNSVASANIADDSIVNADINSAAAIAYSKLNLANSITTDDIALDTIAAVDIATGAVGTLEIADGVITTTDISGTAAITDAQVSDTLTASTLTGTAVGDANIAAGAVDGGALGEIEDGTITTDDIALDTILAADIATGAVGTAEIADGVITAADLATAAKTNIVSVQIGDIALSASATTERPIFVAPQSGTVTAISFTNASNITGAVNLGTLSVERKTATATTVDSFALTSSMTAYTAVRDATPTGGTTLAVGDVYSFKYVQGSTGQALDEMLVTIEFTASD